MLSELLRESRLSENLKYYGKDKSKFFKTRLIYGIIFMLLAGMIILYLQKYNLFYIPLITFVIGYKMPYYSIVSKKSRDDLLNSYLFPEFLSTFMALIPSSGNVYQTLVATLPYTRDPLKSRLEDLIAKLEEDNNRDHYLEFANYIDTGESYMIMDMIYQFSEFGIKKESLQELQGYVSEIQKNKINEMISKKMASMDYLGYLPIFVSMFTVVGFAAVILLYYWGGVSGSITNLGQ